MRGAHGLDLALDGSADVARYVTLPRPVTNAIDEFKVRDAVAVIKATLNSGVDFSRDIKLG